MFEVIISELADMKVAYLLNALTVIVFAWFPSHYAKQTFPRLLWSGLGLYIIAGQLHQDAILLNVNTQFGFGLIVPHIRFLYFFVLEVVNIFKLFSLDGYTFLITIYYRTINSIMSVLFFFQNIDMFFKNFGRGNSQDEDYEQTYRRRQQYSGGFENKRKFNEEGEHQNFKQDKQQSEQKSNHKSHHEERSDSQQQSSSYKEPKYEKVDSQAEHSNSKYAQFYSKNHYTVLGVDKSMTLSEIKKIYRKLAKMYHPDKNRGMEAELTPVLQKINASYAYMKQYHTQQ